MKKKLFFKFFVFAVIGALVTMTSCKDYDDDITRIDTGLNGVKSDLTSQLAAIKTEMNSSVDSKVKTVADGLAAEKAELDKLKAELATLKASAAGDAEIAALEKKIADSKTEIMETVITLEAFNNFKASNATQLDTLTLRVIALEENSATKAEMEALEAEIAGKLVALQGQLDALDLRVVALEKSYADLLAKHNEDVQDLIEKIAALKSELDPRITTIETLLEIADGKSGALNKITDELAAQLVKIGANADAIALLRTDLEEGLAEQLALIEANKAAIEDVAEDLAAKYAELVAVDEGLQEQITKNAGDIEALAMRVKVLEDKIPVIEKSITDLGSAMNLRINAVFQSLDKRVTSLTFIPDFTSQDGTPQLPVTDLGEWYKPDAEVENWDPDLRDDRLLKYYKGITYAKFNVSPSNATLDDFEVVGLLHKTSEILFRSNAEPLLKAISEDATLENGILTVPILVNADLYDIDNYFYNDQPSPSIMSVYPDDDEELFYDGTFNEETNISVALQVKNKNMDEDDDEERKVVSTEYVRAQLSLLFARIEVIKEDDKVGKWGNILPSHMADDIALDTYYKESASIELWNGYNRNTLVYNKDYRINLNDYLRAIAKYNKTWRILEEFGYDNIENHFVFELMDVENEGVDQSNRYVELNEATGVISVKPAANGTANQAAVGRTPIVLVKVVAGGKVYAVGYLKIVITEEVDNSPVKFEFTLEDYLLGCDSEYSLTDVDINEIDFDQIFNHPRIKLGKDAFFAAYRANYDWQIRTRVIEDPAGATGDEIDFHWNIVEPTQGGDLNNYIEAIIENDAPAGKYVIETTLRGRANQPDVVITWTVNVVLPEGISLITNSIYYKNGGIIVNPTIYEQGALSSTAYEALLNNTFVHESGNFDYEGLTQTCQDYLTPYFVFTEVPAGFTISTDKKSILKGGLKAAEIVQVGDEFFVRLNNIGSNPPSGPWGNNTPFSDAAKQLVGKTVKIQPRAYINSQPLNDISLYDPFTVMFRKPLTLQFPDNAVVYDQANDGVKNVYTLNLYSPTVIKDWNGKLISVLTNEGRSLIEHYEIDFTMEWHPGNWWNPSTWELGSPFKLGKPQVNLQVDGTIGGAYRDIPMGTGMKIDIDYEEGEIYTHPYYGSMNTPATITFEWSNSSTGEVQNEFMVRIPITVKHKWSPADEPLMDYLYITVKPGNGN
jgi:predicted  nucleic acid-binding Zn-ribbon protein